jgi:hypothetical protein
MSRDDDRVYHQDFIGPVNKYYALGHDMAKASRVDIDPKGGPPFWMLILAMPTLPFAILGTPVVYFGCAIVKERPRLFQAYLATVSVLLTFLITTLLALGLSNVAPALTSWLVGAAVLISGRVLSMRLELRGFVLFLYGCGIALAALAVCVGVPLAAFVLFGPWRDHFQLPW